MLKALSVITLLDNNTQVRGKGCHRQATRADAEEGGEDMKDMKSEWLVLGLCTCEEVAFAGAIEADDAIVSGTEIPAHSSLAVRLEAMDGYSLDVHCAAPFSPFPSL